MTAGTSGARVILVLAANPGDKVSLGNLMREMSTIKEVVSRGEGSQFKVELEPATRLSPSSERAVRESRAPYRANSAAQAAPMPSEAPVMSTTFPSICM